MTDCIPNADNTRCTVCGWRWKRGGKWPRRNCPGADTPEARAKREAELATAETAYRETIGPSLPAKTGHYAAALLRWARAGCPVRSDGEVTAIVVTCQACEKYAGGSCSVCGCKVSHSPWPMANKARMATEVCPLGKWPAQV
ncbi:MAG: hypothetical protein WC378_00305 [Opitutaceae bacterium]|jgi:hypothetical protein